MNSIRNKIISAFALVIVVFVILVTITVAIEFGLVSKYNNTNVIIIHEQSLKTDISLLAEYGYNAFKTGDYKQYDSKLNEVNSHISILDTYMADKITNNETSLAYRSLKNSLNIVVKNFNDVRIQLEKSGSIIGISSGFSEASSQFDFVKSNID